MQRTINNLQLTANDERVEVYIASPHQFLKEHQQELLPDWKVEVVSAILFLQRSQISLRECSAEVAQEKDCLRANFIRYGCQIVFALQDLGYRSDLFDPRYGYPLLSRQGNITFDDNAAVKALLHYSVSSYKNCSLIEHPNWGNNIYPGTIVTQAKHHIVERVVAKTPQLLDRLKTIY